MKLARSIKNYAKRLDSAARWHKSKLAVSHALSSDEEGDYVYEFFVLLSILDNLTKSYKLRYKPDPFNRHHFPKASASKRNYPYFTAHQSGDDQETFQICPGTEVVNKFGHSIHPDISFQKAKTGENPTSVDLIMIIDAKHKLDEATRITGDDVKVFAIDVKNFEIPNHVYSISFVAPLDVIDKCAIVTNAKPHLDSDGMLAEYGCIIIYDFYPQRMPEVLR
jgi:hypothetical protein